MKIEKKDDLNKVKDVLAKIAPESTELISNKSDWVNLQIINQDFSKLMLDQLRINCIS